MEPMKVLVRIFAVLVALVVLAGFGLGLFLDSAVRTAVERGGTHALGVETRLEKADIGLFSGQFALAGLTIANPGGFAEPNFFALRSTSLELPLATLMEDKITIPALAIEGVTLDLERNASGTNYQKILDHLEQLGGGDADGSGKGSSESSKGGKAFRLERLVIRDVRATVSLLPAGGELTKLSLAVPEIVMERFDSEMSLVELCALVVRTVVQAAVQAGADTLPAELLADLRGRVGALEGLARGKIGETLGGLESKLGEEAHKLGPGAEQALQEATNKLDEKLGGKLDGLLNKKKE
jgi:hypothetical protein